MAFTSSSWVAYDAAGDPTSTIDELGNSSYATYDAMGRVLTTQDAVQAAAGKVTSYAYDPAGNLLKVTDALGHVTSFAYSARDQLTGLTDPANQGTPRQTTFVYDPDGNLQSMTDPNGFQTTYAYDGVNREAGTTDPLGHRTTYGYDLAGELSSVTDPDGHTTSYYYDKLGRLQTEIPATLLGGGQSWTTFTYDPDGNLLAVTDPLSHATSYGYDVLNQRTSATDALGHATRYGHDVDGDLSTVADPLGHVTSYAYDVRNRRVSTTDPAGGGTTTMTYDAAGDVASVTDPVGNVTRYGYDANERVATEADPLGKVTTYAYDVEGNLTQVIDRLGRITSLAYDADNRETVQQWIPVGGGTATYTMTVTYDPGGRETQVQDNFSKYAYTYDNANRPLTVDDAGTAGLPQVTLTYGYDPTGNRTSLADTKGGVNSYAYDARDRLTTITQSGTGVASKLAAIAYDAANRETSLTRYSDLIGSAEVAGTIYAYDVADRLTTLTNQTAGGASISSYAYTLDAADRLTSEVRTWGASSTDTVGYTYTNNNQLTGVTHTNGSFANEGFGFDANGNRNTANYATGTDNELSADGTYTYTYDAEGNLTVRTQIASPHTQTTYTYDYRNRLTEVDQTASGVHSVVAQYTYDALNNPIKVVEGGATRYTLYDGQTPLLDFNGAGTVTARYLSDPRAVDALLARETAGGVVAWYIVDRLGTVRDLVSSSDAVIDHVDYTAFGTTTDSSPSNGDRFKYAGMELDAATGFDYDRARWYNPLTGTFIDRDPVGFAGGDANLYRYVGNSPTNSTDPRGLWDGKHNKILDALQEALDAGVADPEIISWIISEALIQGNGNTTDALALIMDIRQRDNGKLDNDYWASADHFFQSWDLQNIHSNYMGRSWITRLFGSLTGTAANVCYHDFKILGIGVKQDNNTPPSPPTWQQYYWGQAGANAGGMFYTKMQIESPDWKRFLIELDRFADRYEEPQP